MSIYKNIKNLVLIYIFILKSLGILNFFKNYHILILKN